MADKPKKEHKGSSPSVSGGMIEAEAMQRVIDLQAKLRESGGPGQPLSAVAEPSPRSETADERRERLWPGLTAEDEAEMAALIGG